MCGFAGGINARITPASIAALQHRGPDQADFLSEELPGLGRLVLGQARLNIVDQENLDLPVGFGKSRILFNGEIYNWRDLRRDLVKAGWRFTTQTDTETVLAAYLEWGTECLPRFNGMFAFVVWDGAGFFAARDRMGQKPLYYRMGPGRFEFASELKALDRLEYVGHELFELFEFCFDGFTLFRDVHALPPGSYLTYDPLRGLCNKGVYWSIEPALESRISDAAAAVDLFIEILEDATRLRCQADVPVSLFLSGGLDSALLAKCSGLGEAFTCQFDELRDSIDEEHFARDLADQLGLRLHLVRPSKERFLEDLPRLARHLEMPTGSFSVFPLYCLAGAARAAGYKVVLTGEGADELFAGYVRNELLVFGCCREDTPKRRQYGDMLARFHGSDLDRFCRMASRSGLEGASRLRPVLAQHWRDELPLVDNICYLESRIFLQPLLQMLDRMTMAHGVEARCPYLDHRIVELAFSLDPALRCRDGIGKWLVHQAAERVLPKGARVLKREVKHGLPTPVNLWMQGRHSFDRSFWHELMTAECVKNLATGGSALGS